MLTLNGILEWDRLSYEQGFCIRDVLTFSAEIVGINVVLSGINALLTWRLMWGFVFVMSGEWVMSTCIRYGRGNANKLHMTDMCVFKCPEGG
ncbi:uncharacterized protein T551_01351 [Pneumocystis jirovecii RU7]|uniref:Uncharacterized protein n=1 Tax=Pneumocystis jirovecii (strain RU7) TaxID=1408657 RepID=A0A0W4ZSE5_PNEJ7|nr:uncharacterized protein T551_01351 [Pneumocystis jirovecii RU7]KTW31279.1 hypothetical protein T551_01351 [Pneumocystis jirovecii RU7]